MFYLINILTLGCNGAMMIHDDLFNWCLGCYGYTVEYARLCQI